MFVFMYIFVCMYMYVCMYMFVSMYMFVCMYMFACMDIYVCMYVYTYNNLCIDHVMTYIINISSRLVLSLRRSWSFGCGTSPRCWMSVIH